jgi:diadenosine tetraphosphate (Ap4A) HIT family hydrolase
VVDQPWLRDENYCAIASKGALVPGWSLVCPVDHSVNLSTFYGRSDFWQFANLAADTIRARYGDVRIFEHGAGHPGSLTGCGTDHAHLHIVPLEFSLLIEAVRQDSKLKWSFCDAKGIEKYASGREYLYVSDRYEGEKTTGLVCLLDSPISQFFRRVIAARLGLREFFDYRRHPMLDIAEQTATQLGADIAQRNIINAR